LSHEVMILFEGSNYRRGSRHSTCRDEARRAEMWKRRPAPVMGRWGKGACLLPTVEKIQMKICHVPECFMVPRKARTMYSRSARRAGLGGSMDS
jgi:hypothetical protein